MFDSYFKNSEDYHFINRTEVKKDDLNPEWEELILDHEDIRPENLQTELKLEVTPGPKSTAMLSSEMIHDFDHDYWKL